MHVRFSCTYGFYTHEMRREWRPRMVSFSFTSDRNKKDQRLVCVCVREFEVVVEQEKKEKSSCLCQVFDGSRMVYI